MSIIYEALQKIEKKTEPPKALFTPKEVFSPQPRVSRWPLWLFVLIVALSLSMAGTKLMRLAQAPATTTFAMPTQPRNQALTAPAGSGSSDIMSSHPTAAHIPYSLQGIIYDSQHPLAIINGKQLGIGQSIDDATVVEITQKGVELAVKGVTMYIPLEE